MIDMQFKLEGAREMEKALAKLETKMSRSIIRQGVRAGQRPVLVEAKDRASHVVGGDMGGRIARNLVLRVEKKKAPGSYAKHGDPRSPGSMAVSTQKGFTGNTETFHMNLV